MRLSDRSWAALAVVITGLLVVLVQLRGGAYSSDFSADEDEPAHAVSSLAVHDYLAHGPLLHPIGFGENYYVHYSKVAIGHFPPLYYLCQGIWMLVFGRTRAAMIAFSAVLGAAFLSAIFLWTRRNYGALAAVASLLFAAAPKFVQTQFLEVAPNFLLGLLTFGAAVFLGRFLERRQRRYAVLSAALCLAAIGTHGRGAMLAFLPFALILCGRLGWTRLRILGFSSLIAVVIMLPPWLQQSAPLHLQDIPVFAAQYLTRLFASMGWGTAALALAGAIVLFRTRGKSMEGAAILALLLSGWAFHSLIAAGLQDHYLITVLPAVAILAAAGVHAILEAMKSGAGKAAVLCCVAGSLLLTALPLARKPDTGYHALAPGSAPLMDRVAFIAADARNEGAFIAEGALRDPQLHRFALRASKLLATSSWGGYGYQLRYSTPAEVRACLDAARIQTILIAPGDPRPHVSELLQTIRGESWKETPLPGLPKEIVAFERTSPPLPGDPVFSMETSSTFIGTLGSSSPASSGAQDSPPSAGK